jgi:hypothetical protein
MKRSELLHQQEFPRSGAASRVLRPVLPNKRMQLTDGFRSKERRIVRS